ncbi:MAG: hypothetical protein JNJ89_15300 [Rubrivivax sp.]|nr:hypothetical protein [Rubrivivax sp.]
MDHRSVRMRRWVALPALVSSLAAGVAAGTPAGACPLPPVAGEHRVTQGALELAWRAEPERLAVGQPFSLEVRLCPAAARFVQVDATMPEHRHGMNYRPSVQPLGPGRWRAEGLLWHMAGRWELAFEVESGGERTWLKYPLMLR